ncbi:hypothetical protein ISR94_00760 [Candidatus Microgenomates bacterium]|nr:hypothetical protein [Candidatus Microgenomates bacterium]
MDDSLKNLINSATSILVLLPGNPHLDEVTAGLVLQTVLKDSKNASISCPSPMTVEFSRLVGVTKISTQLGNKNLIVTFPNYPADNIEKVSYDIENEQFKLSVIPKPGFNAPVNEQMAINYEGVGADTVILVGGDKEENFPALNLPELAGVKLIHIGTKLLETTNKLQILSFAKASSSVSEQVAGIVKDMGAEIDADMATNLLAGIENGSQYFQGGEVTEETFKLFARLLSYGGKRFKKVPPNTYPQGAIPSQPYNQPQGVKQPVQQAPQPVLQPQQVTNSQVQQSANPQSPLKTEDDGQVPQAWSEPKVYTGTSVN